MHSKKDNMEIMFGNETNEINEALFDSLLHKYQKDLEESTRGSELIFYNVDLLYYKCRKI